MSSLVFSCDDLRRHILSFVVHLRCIECHQPVTTPPHPSDALLYRNLEWTKSKCKKTNILVCNWCYHYVWGYG